MFSLRDTLRFAIVCLLVLVGGASAAHAQSYQGYQEGTYCTYMYGWAWSPSSPNSTLTVDIYDGNAYLGSTNANIYRQDLYNAQVGNGSHGFSFTMPASIQNGQSHSISVRYGGTTQILTNSPQSVTCSSQPAYQGYFDNASCSTLSGWAWNANNQASHVSVTITSDGTQIGYISATGYRQDLRQNNVGDGTHAWQMATPQSLADGNSHTINVTYESSGIALVNSPRTIQCGSFSVTSGGSTTGSGQTSNVSGSGTFYLCYYKSAPVGESHIDQTDANLHTYSATRMLGTGGYLWDNSLTNVALKLNGADIPGSPHDYSGSPTSGSASEQVDYYVNMDSQGYGSYTQSAHHRWTSDTCAPYFYTYPPQGDSSVSATFTAPPTISSVSPSEIYTGIDNTVTIYGSGFGGNPTVEVDSGITATVQSASETQIIVVLTVPEGNGDGNVNLTVLAAPGRATTTELSSKRRPHHLKITSDINGYLIQCNYQVYRRVVSYVIVGVDSNPVTFAPFYKESFDSVTANTCGNPVSTSTTCHMSNSTDAYFSDDMNVGCTGNSNCGFTATNQYWYWCPLYNNPNQQSIPIAHVGTLVVTDSSVSVNGNSTFYRAGTEFYP